MIIKNIWAFILKARPDSTCSCGITVQLHCMLNGDRDMCFMNTLLVKYTTRQRYPGKSRAETHIVRRSLVLRLIAIALSLSLSLFLSLSHTHTHTHTHKHPHLWLQLYQPYGGRLQERLHLKSAAVKNSLFVMQHTTQQR